jgi:hypothetical protein
MFSDFDRAIVLYNNLIKLSSQIKFFSKIRFLDKGQIHYD